MPPAERTHDWALVDMLATETEYYGKLRVILYNLRRGIDPKPPIATPSPSLRRRSSKLADQFLAAGHFQTIDRRAGP